MNIVEEVKNRLSVFKNLYDIFRLVDPVNKKTITVNDNSIEESKGYCYDFWKRDEFCKNCISIRAYLEDDTFVKIQNNEGKIFLVTATPLILNNNRYIVEILKDITQNGKIQTKNDSSENYTEYVLNELNEKIIKDELTGVYNRRYINETLPVNINKSIVKQYPLSVIMADIDFFKKINDNYGHLIGDKILIDFCKLVKYHIRKSTDWLSRYGGEEFLIVLQDTDLHSAYKVAEDIRKSLENTVFQYDDIKIKITASLGVHQLSSHKNNMDELLLGADRNLYHAKITGRNKTVMEL
ncbi:GGDEF domain-containing protein, partial [Clostridium cylindrosporum]|uniref:Response regulator PleD n=1 Tax=Clostridium cylindrosporum DSM 605 TaxID=1121307 RepID=A0A0J8D940_CLOCY